MTPNTSEMKKKNRRDSEDYVEVLTSEERKTLLHVSGHSSLQQRAALACLLVRADVQNCSKCTATA